MREARTDMRKQANFRSMAGLKAETLEDTSLEIVADGPGFRKIR
jgi:hypothetical protein